MARQHLPARVFRVNYSIHASVSSSLALRLSCSWRQQFAPTELHQATTGKKPCARSFCLTARNLAPAMATPYLPGNATTPMIPATIRGDCQMERKHEKYETLLARCKEIAPTPTAVAHPCDESSLRGAVEAAEIGIIQPLLVGPRSKIEEVAKTTGLNIAPYELIDAEHSHAAADMAVQLAREGRAELLMKGSLHTDELMAAVVRSGTGLRTERRISHCFIMDVPHLDRPIIISDAAINIFPTMEDKMHIIQNAIDLAHSLGIEKPKVAILSAMETINPKLQSTIEAGALCKMADRGQITGGILDGPLALDNAIDLDAAKIKKIESPVAGRADILVVPDLEAGNMLAKSLSFMADADAAGIVLGARVPIILTSRADSVLTRLASCAVAALVAAARRQQAGKAVAG
ncbi:MAG: phosphate acetyltransferase [Dechloromonas sp.]|nr:phosphate acetyltransferase [Dechloromonas sp.]